MQGPESPLFCTLNVRDLCLLLFGPAPGCTLGSLIPQAAAKPAHLYPHITDMKRTTLQPQHLLHAHQLNMKKSKERALHN